jgi:hypothetical protein
MDTEPMEAICSCGVTELDMAGGPVAQMANRLGKAAMSGAPASTAVEL